MESGSLFNCIDHITRLAHCQVNVAPSIGRRWFVDSPINPLIGTREQIERKRKQFEGGQSMQPL